MSFEWAFRLQFFFLIFSQKNLTNCKTNFSKFDFFHDFLFLKYNRLDFRLRKAFHGRDFAKVHNYKQNFKRLLLVLDFQLQFFGRVVEKQSKGLE